MWIVKLGGSLAADPLLRDWLDMLSDCGRGRVVIVPGGGPFADRVREAQQHWDFDDGAAHRMAILAMDQYGQMLVALCPALTPAASPDQLFAVLKEAGVAVWLPSAMLGAGDAVPQDWSVTSDSLAAWLAQQISAQALVLVKSCAVPADGASSEELADLGVVDPSFPEFARRGCFANFILNRTQPARLRQMLLEWNPATAR
jgi:5-(aminomethyl)-3-furanmethanol phosphate kinase